MLRVVLSIMEGKIAPSTILKRLGSQSRKNKLYYAFRELGRAVRTQFLLQYIHDIELRRTISAATNKSEESNQFADWIAFASKVNQFQRAELMNSASHLAVVVQDWTPCHRFKY